MTGRFEKVFQRSLLVGAVIAWGAAITFTIGVYTERLEALRGWGMIANMCLALAVTLTIVWAQFRLRRIIADIFRAGAEVQRQMIDGDRELP